jgi:predicted molibdopterin-dependent oxidoreductase YjgC
VAQKFPLVFNTGSREPMYVHSRHRNNPRLRELQPDPKLDINPKDAQARGIKQSDDVIVQTPAGRITVKANVTNLTQPGVVHVFHGGDSRGTVCGIRRLARGVAALSGAVVRPRRHVSFVPGARSSRQRSGFSVSCGLRREGRL